MSFHSGYICLIHPKEAIATMPFVNTYRRFSILTENLKITETQRQDGVTKHTGVRSCLNSHYYADASGYNNSMLVGSWGKATQIRPPRDIDVLFALPFDVYQRYEQRPLWANKQSELLQEVKGVLARTYSTTKLKADGQVVIVPFATYGVEVVPAFGLTGGQYLICDTNNGGSYKRIDPIAEQAAVTQSSDATKGNTRNLIRIMKRWQEFCNVPIKSFWVELLAVSFMASWEYSKNSYLYYDWMCRDFFAFLNTKSNGYIFVPGTFESIGLGNDWKSKAESAYARAVKACDYEHQDKEFDAWWEWKNIFGEDVPYL